jgi:hypothetical protein
VSVRNNTPLLRRRTVRAAEGLPWVIASRISWPAFGPSGIASVSRKRIALVEAFMRSPIVKVMED